MRCLILVLLSFFLLNFLAPPVFAQNIDTDPAKNDLTGWVEDKDVTFAGQSLIRASNLVKWVLENYQWSDVKVENAQNQIPLVKVFREVQFTVYALLSLMILIGAFLIIITRGQSLTIKTFALRFTFTIALVFLSFAIINGIYIIFDVIQNFFLKIGQTDAITSKSLLNVGTNVDYKNFNGYRLGDLKYEESAFMNTLLVKLTAITYYLMFVVLIVRKVIMWFFIIASPIFPLLLLFPHLKNVARVWLGQFFFWVLYGPLFAVFLFGLVTLWKNGAGVPLDLALNCTTPEYHSATNILLGGPNQTLNFDTNNLSCTDNFIQYVVALVMVWVVILLPFVLLKVFLDYFQNVNISKESGLIKYLVSASSPLTRRYRELTSSSRENNMLNFKHSPQERMEKIIEQAKESLSSETQGLSTPVVFKHSPLETISPPTSKPAAPAQTPPSLSNIPPIPQRIPSQQGKLNLTPADTQILNQTNLPIPNLTQVAKYEAASIAESHPLKAEVANINNTLGKIANPSISPSEQQRYQEIRSQLTGSIPMGSHVVASIIEATKTSDQASLPQVNQVQLVTPEDLVDVKKAWKENYEKINPKNKTFILEEVEKTKKAMELLSSKDPNDIKKGQEIISETLPFLLLGGFSNGEVVDYLKAKLDAASEIAGITTNSGNGRGLNDPDNFWKKRNGE